MNAIDEIEKVCLSETGNSLLFLSDYGIPKTEITSLMLLYDNCKYNVGETIDYFINEYLKRPKIFGFVSPYLEVFLTFYENKVLRYAEYTDFIHKSANIYLNNYRTNPELEKHPLDRLYRHPKGGGKFVDLISGFGFIDFLDDLDTETTYYLIDKSLLTCECLKISIAKKGLANVFVINKDIRDVVINDIGENVAVVRAKNIWNYIPNFYDHIEKFKSFIIKDGIFIFQENSVNRVFDILNIPNTQYANLDSCFENNWIKKEIIQPTSNMRAFDTIIYRRIY